MKTFVSIAGLAAVLAMGPAFADDDPTVAEQITDAVTQADSEDVAPDDGVIVDAIPTPVNGQVTDAETQPTEVNGAIVDAETDTGEDSITSNVKTPGVYEDEAIDDMTETMPGDAVEDTDVNLNLENHSNDEDNGEPVIFHHDETTEPETE